LIFFFPSDNKSNYHRTFLLDTEFKSKVYQGAQLFTKESENVSIKEVYSKCTPPPNLPVLDRFRDDGPSMKVRFFFFFF